MQSALYFNDFDNHIGILRLLYKKVRGDIFQVLEHIMRVI